MNEDTPERPKKIKASVSLDEDLVERILDIVENSKGRVSISSLINYFIKTSPHLERLEEKYSKEKSEGKEQNGK